MPWRRGWQPTPVFLPGGSHGQRGLADFSSWGWGVKHNLVTKQQQPHSHLFSYHTPLCSSQSLAFWRLLAPRSRYSGSCTRLLGASECVSQDTARNVSASPANSASEYPVTPPGSPRASYFSKRAATERGRAHNEGRSLPVTFHEDVCANFQL